MQHAAWLTNSIAVRACNRQEFCTLHITGGTEGNVNGLSTFALQLRSLCFAHGRYYDVRTANHAVCVTSCWLSYIVLSHGAYITDSDLRLPVY